MGGKELARLPTPPCKAAFLLERTGAVVSTLRFRFLFTSIAVAWFAAASAGCNREIFSIVPVSGKVTYDDGSLIKAGMIQVMLVPQGEPVDGKYHAPPSGADVDMATGEFKDFRTRQGKPGVVVGTHKVIVVSKTKDGLKNTFEVPAEYQSAEATPLEPQTISKPNQVLELKIPKPKGRQR